MNRGYSDFYDFSSLNINFSRGKLDLDLCAEGAGDFLESR
jgi:hypothetical protein